MARTGDTASAELIAVCLEPCPQACAAPGGRCSQGCGRRWSIPGRARSPGTGSQPSARALGWRAFSPFSAFLSGPAAKKKYVSYNNLVI